MQSTVTIQSLAHNSRLEQQIGLPVRPADDDDDADADANNDLYQDNSTDNNRREYYSHKFCTQQHLYCSIIVNCQSLTTNKLYEASFSQRDAISPIV